MNIDELIKLEEKVNHMVNRLKALQDENKAQKKEIESMRKQTSLDSQSRMQIEKKVTALIQLIDSIEKE